MKKTFKVLSLALFLLIVLQSMVFSEEYGKYGLNTDDNTSNIIEYILEENRKMENKNTNIFLVDEYVNHIMEFTDLEKDYYGISLMDKLKDNEDLSSDIKKPKQLLAKYEHNPSVFDNPVSKHNKDNGKFNKITSMKDPYIINKAEASMRGNWSLTLKGEDDTKNPTWNKWSDDKKIDFIIHEKPKAIIELWKEDSTGTVYPTGEKSFDLDFQYRLPNRGIVKAEWEYQTEDGTWHPHSDTLNRISIPKIAGGKNVTNYSLTVFDCYGASDTAIAAIEQPILMEPEAIIVAPESIYVGPLGSDTLSVTNDSEPKASIKSYQYTFNFKSISNFMNTTQSTIVNSDSYTFAKNTLKYANGTNEFNRNVTLKVTSLTNHISEATEMIKVIPVVIDKLETSSINSSMVTFKAEVKNANPTDHKVIATVKGVDYVMTHKDGQRWEVDVNILGADKLYARVEKKLDSAIVYDRGEVVANRPPTAEISVSPNKIYEGDSVNVKVKGTDPDLDKLTLEVRQRVNHGAWKLIWSKDNVVSGEEQSFSINKVVEGNHELQVTAIDPHNATGIATTTFNVLPIKISGKLQPNPAMAGDEIHFFIETEGFVDTIEIIVPNDMISKDNRKQMGYREVDYPLTFNVNGAVENKEDIFKYIVWVNTNLTIDKDNSRLRDPYTFIVRGYKEDIMREIELELDIKGDIRNLLKPGIKNKYGN